MAGSPASRRLHRAQVPASKSSHVDASHQLAVSRRARSPFETPSFGAMRRRESANRAEDARGHEDAEDHEDAADDRGHCRVIADPSPAAQVPVKHHTVGSGIRARRTGTKGDLRDASKYEDRTKYVPDGFSLGR